MAEGAQAPRAPVRGRCVFIMEYEDFLTHWEVIERTQVFDPTWIQSSHWLEVTAVRLSLLCNMGMYRVRTSILWNAEYMLIDMICVCVCSQIHAPPKDRRRYSSCPQSDDRFYRSLGSSSVWSFDFKLFKVGDSGKSGPLRFRTFPTSSTEAIHSASNLRLETMSSMCVSQVVLTTTI